MVIRNQPVRNLTGTRRDFSGLGRGAKQTNSDAENGAAPRLDLLAATANGAPNVVSFYVDKAIKQGIKEYDDAFVIMNFKLAQQLLYGRGEQKAVSIVLQLNRTEDIPVARARLEKLVKEKGLDLETKELTELQPFYNQAVGMFMAIFSFISDSHGGDRSLYRCEHHEHERDGEDP